MTYTMRVKLIVSLEEYRIIPHKNWYSKYNMCIIKKSYIGAHSWVQLLSVHFFVRNMGKIVPPPNKNGVFLDQRKPFLPC